MKFKYQSVTETVEIEVSEEWGNILIDLDRQEYNNNQTETRRHCSLEALNLDDALLPSDVDVLGSLIEAQGVKEIYDAIYQLKPQHRDLILNVCLGGVSTEEYAARCGVTPGAISQRKNTAIKNLKKLLRKT